MTRTGTGREDFPSFEDALEVFRVPLDNQPLMREIVGELDVGRVWIPPSQRYIAVAPPAGPVVAYFMKGIVETHQPGGGYLRHLMPVSFERAAGGHRGPQQRAAQLCPSCHLELPTSGSCGWCG